MLRSVKPSTPTLTVEFWSYGELLVTGGCVCRCVSGRMLQLYQSSGSPERRDALRLWYQRLQPHLQELQGNAHL